MNFESIYLLSKEYEITGRYRMGKNEVKFYECFQNIIGKEYLKSKSVDKKVSKDDIFLSSNYLEYDFNDNTINIIEKILKCFKSDFNIPSRYLASYIDGITVNHPQLGTRIIEFDEEQHFSPYRENELVILKQKHIDLWFIDSYLELCRDIRHFNIMLKKHRIKYNSNDIVSLSKLSDMLRDLAHLSPKNSHLKQIIRFSKYEI